MRNLNGKMAFMTVRRGGLGLAKTKALEAEDVRSIPANIGLSRKSRGATDCRSRSTTIARRITRL